MSQCMLPLGLLLLLLQLLLLVVSRASECSVSHRCLSHTALNGCPTQLCKAARSITGGGGEEGGEGERVRRAGCCRASWCHSTSQIVSSFSSLSSLSACCPACCLFALCASLCDALASGAHHRYRLLLLHHHRCHCHCRCCSCQTHPHPQSVAGLQRWVCGERLLQGGGRRARSVAQSLLTLPRVGEVAALRLMPGDVVAHVA